MESSKPAHKALALMVFAWNATRSPTKRAAQVCNERLRMARDFLAHSPSEDVVASGVVITAQEFEEVRAEALGQLRAQCGVCGLCKKHGVPPA